jgi:hypothetical protein
VWIAYCTIHPQILYINRRPNVRNVLILFLPASTPLRMSLEEKTRPSSFLGLNADDITWKKEVDPEGDPEATPTADDHSLTQVASNNGLATLEGARDDHFLVSWDGPDDPGNPHVST